MSEELTETENCVSPNTEHQQHFLTPRKRINKISGAEIITIEMKIS